MQRYFVKLRNSILESLSEGKGVVASTRIAKDSNFRQNIGKILFFNSYELINATDDVNVYLINELPNNGTLIRIVGYWNTGSRGRAARQPFKIYMGVGINSTGHLVIEEEVI